MAETSVPHDDHVCTDFETHLAGCGFEADVAFCSAEPEAAEELLALDCSALASVAQSADSHLSAAFHTSTEVVHPNGPSCRVGPREKSVYQQCFEWIMDTNRYTGCTAWYLRQCMCNNNHLVAATSPYMCERYRCESGPDAWCYRNPANWNPPVVRGDSLGLPCPADRSAAGVSHACEASCNDYGRHVAWGMCNNGFLRCTCI